MSLKYDGNKLTIVCPQCKNETFEEDSSTPTMVAVDMLIEFQPPSTTYKCRKCGAYIGNPYKKLPKGKELDLIKDTFPFLFDDDTSIPNSGDTRISMVVENKDLRRLQKIFLRFWGP